MTFRIHVAPLEEAEQVFAAMRLAFEEYRGKLVEWRDECIARCY